MLILTDDDKSIFDKKHAQHENKYGFAHLSQSSINDARDCFNKFKLRSKFRTVNLKASVGKLVHEFLEFLGEKAAERQQQSKSAEEREAAVLSARDDIDWDLHIETRTRAAANSIAQTILLGQELCGEKDYPVMSDPENLYSLFHFLLTQFKDLVLFNDERILTLISTGVSIGSEVKGYTFIHDRLLYGIIDRVSYYPETNSIEIVDYKSTWSSGGITNWKKKTSTLQGWIYFQFVKEYIDKQIPRGLPKPEEINIEYHVLGYRLPRVKSAEEYFEKNIQKDFDLFVIPMNLTERSNNLYDNTVYNCIKMITNDIGMSGDPKFGCAYCDYRFECDLYTGELPDSTITDGSKAFKPKASLEGVTYDN